MASFRARLGLAIFLLSYLVWITAAQVAIEILDRYDGPPAALVYNAKVGEASNFGEIPLDGRSLIASWLGKRQGCSDSGYSPCISTLFNPQQRSI